MYILTLGVGGFTEGKSYPIRLSWIGVFPSIPLLQLKFRCHFLAFPPRTEPKC